MGTVDARAGFFYTRVMLRILVAATLVLFACGSSSRTLEEVDKLLGEATMTVDKSSAAQIVADNSDKDELLTAMSVGAPGLPVGFILQVAAKATSRLATSAGPTAPAFLDNACNGVEKTSKPVTKDLELDKLTGGGVTGKAQLTTTCSQTSFALQLTLSNACVNGKCYEGTARYQFSGSKLVWTFKTPEKPRQIDLAGIVELHGGEVKDVKVVLLSGEQEKTKVLRLNWSNNGFQKYAEYFLTGENGRFRCNHTEAKKSCRQLDSADKPTGTEFDY